MCTKNLGYIAGLPYLDTDVTHTHSNTQYLLKNVTNAQTVRNRTRNQTEYNYVYVYVCAKKMSK